MLKLAYSFFLGILLALFVGMGIAAFYAQPEMPKYPTELNLIDKEPTAEQKAIQRDFDAQQEAWNEKMKPYNRNVSIITLVAAVSFVAISLLFEHKIKLLADGVMLGGVFTLLYSMGRGFASQDSKYTFALSYVGLIVALTLGYLRFIKPEQEPKGKPKAKAI